MTDSKKDVAALIQSLDHLSPLKTISRGYAIAQSKATVIKSVDQVKAEDPISIMVSDGLIKARVEEAEKKDNDFKGDHHE